MSENCVLSIEKDLPSYRIKRGWLIGEHTKLLDRYSPILEEHYLPEFASPEGRLMIKYDAGTLTVSDSKKARKVQGIARALLRRKVVQSELCAELCTLDFRVNSPANWAHAFTNHLPLALLISNLLNISPSGICILLPGTISGRIVELFKLIGFSVVTEDGRVLGKFCQFDVNPWIALRGLRCEVLRQSGVKAQLMAAVAPIPEPSRKIFVSRKDHRKLINEQEVETYLEGFGYEKVYPEELGLVEQISLLTGAEKIVAVHGAGLGPMILKSILGDRSYDLLEIFSPAHITNVYRMIAEQTRGSWIGVRGQVWPDLIGEKANFQNNLMDFSLSIASLQRAMEIQSSDSSSDQC